MLDHTNDKIPLCLLTNYGRFLYQAQTVSVHFSVPCILSEIGTGTVFRLMPAPKTEPSNFFQI